LNEKIPAEKRNGKRNENDTKNSGRNVKERNGKKIVNCENRNPEQESEESVRMKE
jgi:hypothetical protein